MKFTLSLPLLGCLLCATAQAQTSAAAAESDWIELVKGHRGEAMGAEVRSVETDHDEGYRRVYVSIPKTELPPRDDIEEVVVVGQAPEQSEPLRLPEVEYQWLDDYDNDNYGLVIRLSKDSLPIRLFVSSEEGFIR